MKHFDKIPISGIPKILRNCLLILALFSISAGFAQTEDTLQLGEGDQTTSYFPLYYLYNYSYTQTIYTAEELHEKGALEETTDITHIKFKATSTQSTDDWKDWVIYMGNTDQEGFEDDTDWLPSEEMTQVFDGEIADMVHAGEWVDITLDTPFEWDGTSNIVVAVDQNTEEWGNSPNWAGYEMAPNDTLSKGIYYYSDSTNPDPEDPVDANSTSNLIAQIQFVGELLATCEGTPTAGTADEDFSVCAGNAFDISTSGASDPANGLDRVWQSSPAGENDWTDIEEAHSNPFTIDTGVTVATDFRYKVICNNSQEADTSAVISVTLNPALECYCIPENTENSTSYISHITSDGALEELNKESDFADNGYADYTETDTLVVYPGQEIDLSIAFEGGTSHVESWIDYNKNGSFDDDGEHVLSSGNYTSSPYSETITIPDTIDQEKITRLRFRAQYLGGEPTSCVESGYGETEDYTIKIIQLEDCEGTPTAGTVEDDFSVCAGNAFGLNTSNASGPASGLDRIWQSSPAGEDDWTDIEDSSNPNFTLEDGIEEPTDFRYTVICNNSEEADTSAVVSVTLNPALECYCIPENTGNSTNYISHITSDGALEELNKESDFADDGYADYTETDTLVVYPGQEIDLSIAFEGGTSHVESWIDYNKNGSFDDDGEHVLSSGNYTSSPYSETITIPDTIDQEKITRLRFRAQYLGGEPTSCEESGYGETEDYTIKIIQLEDCEGTPTAGTVEDDFSVCAGNAFDLTTSGSTEPANGLDRIWQSSPAGENNWTDIEEANNSNYTLEDGIQEPTDFRYTIICNNSEEADTSDVVSVTLNPGSECYCTPGESSSDYISSLSTSGAVNNIDITNAEASPNGYFDNTSTDTISQVQTVPLDFSASYTGGTFGSKIWVDWNHDGQFSSDEIVYQSSSYSGEASGSFAPPEGAELGTTRMRIGIHWLNSGGPQPCDTDSNTSFMDVTFEVIPLEDCEGTPTAGTADEDFSVCAGNAFDLNTTGASDPANGQDRIWQSSPAGEDTWTDIEGASAANYTLEDGIEEPTDFRYKVVCDFSEESDISEVIHVTLNPALECYCIPENNTNTSYYISEVSTENALQDLDKSSEFSDGGYADYTETDTLIVFPGQEFDYSITGSSSSMSYKGWIDLNQDGQFGGDQENVFSSDGYTNAPFTGTYTVPSDLAEGSYRLRVRASYIGTDLGPCENSTYAETEDYVLKVVIPDCFPPVDITIDYITDNSAQVNWLANGETSWEVIYGPEGFDPNDDEGAGTSVTVNDNPQLDIEDLETDSIYDVYVKTLCGEDAESTLMGPHTFTTNVTPPENTRLCNATELTPNAACSTGTYTTENAFEQVGEPVGSCYNSFHGTNSVWFTFEAVDTTATIDTDYSPTEFATEIAVYKAPTDCEDLTTLGEQVGCATVDQEELVLHDLTIGDTYYVRVAGFNNQAGTFCINLEMHEQSCGTPSDIVVDAIDDSSAHVSWNPGGNEYQWEVRYGEHGFNPGQDGQSQMVSNATETTLEGLEADTQYDVYVRAICNEVTQSNWTGPKSFNTTLDVDRQVFESFTYYPNPVKGQLTLKANAPIESVTVFNLLGQEVISVTPNTLETQVNTEDLQADVYLMKVNINGSHKTFRIIKE